MKKLIDVDNIHGYQYFVRDTRGNVRSGHVKLAKYVGHSLQGCVNACYTVMCVRAPMPVCGEPVGEFGGV